MIAAILAGGALTTAAAPASTTAPAAPATATAAAPTTPAATDAADPAVAQAAEANLESVANRRGVTWGFAFGGGLLAGFGIEDSVGRSGNAVVRVGHVATPNTVISLALDIAGTQHKRTKMSDVATNASIGFSLSAQRYINPSLWLRFGGGVAIYVASDIDMTGKVTGGDLTTWGPMGVFGLGLDVLRWRSLVFDLEATTTMAATGEGVLFSTSAGFGLSFD